MIYFSSSLFALLCSYLFITLIKSISLKKGYAVKPREDRWNKNEIPTLGGIGIYLATVCGLLVYAQFGNAWKTIPWGIFLASSLIFLLGLYDDLKHLTPQAKLLGQIICASLMVYFGYTTNFFTPRISDNLIAQIPNIVLTFLWLVGITNAINLIDNMDGLAGGISLIATFVLIFLFIKGDDNYLLSISTILAGGILGFLIFNFPPASIFMGDSGSMFLGFSLAALAIAKQPQASNVFAVMGVPIVIFLLPIVDTVLVTTTRLLRGQSPLQGGRDHTSHRLIAFGFNEKQAVFILYMVAFISGIVAIVMESLDYDLSLILLPILIISLALFTTYLGRVKVITSHDAVNSQGTILRSVLEYAYKRRVFEIILDFFLIGVAYFMAYWTRFGLSVTEEVFSLYINTLPITLIGAYISFWLFGVYKEVWGLIGIDNLIRFLKATLGAIFITGSMLYILLFFDQIFYPEIVVLFGVFLFLGITATRSSFKIFDLFSIPDIKKGGIDKIFIVGSSENAEMALRYIQLHPELSLKPIGFIAEHAIDIGRRIHGIEILGDLNHLDTLIDQRDIKGVVIADITIMKSRHEEITTMCQNKECWIKLFSFELKSLN